MNTQLIMLNIQLQEIATKKVTETARTSADIAAIESICDECDEAQIASVQAAIARLNNFGANVYRLAA